MLFSQVLLTLITNVWMTTCWHLYAQYYITKLNQPWKFTFIGSFLIHFNFVMFHFDKLGVDLAMEKTYLISNTDNQQCFNLKTRKTRHGCNKCWQIFFTTLTPNHTFNLKLLITRWCTIKWIESSRSSVSFLSSYHKNNGGIVH